MSEAQDCTQDAQQKFMQTTTPKQCATNGTAQVQTTRHAGVRQGKQFYYSSATDELLSSVKQFYIALYQRVLGILTAAFKMTACSLR